MQVFYAGIWRGKGDRMKAKEFFTNWRIIFFIAFLLFAIISIRPSFPDGVAIRDVIPDSAAQLAGIERPEPGVSPVSRERVISINNQPVETVAGYYQIVGDIGLNRTLQIKTNKGLYKIRTRAETEIIELNETESKVIPRFNEETQELENVTVIVNKTETRILGVADIGLQLQTAAKTNIRKGLDLQGGTRVILEPEEKLSDEDMESVLDNMKQRLNVFGLSDINVRESGDLSGNQYIRVEIAGVKEEEVKDLLSKQGKFEAKVGQVTVFRGGNDITYVCRSADCSGIDPLAGCGQTADNQWACRFRFSISLTPEAARKQADATSTLDVVGEPNNQYLSEQLNLYLDDVLVDQLNIGSDLKGSPSTEISITGSGNGFSQQEALGDALDNMKRLQTIMITGSLPVKLNIVTTDSLSATFGAAYLNNALYVGLLAILVVGIIVYIRYRKLKVGLAMTMASISEVIILLGFASLIGWNMDLAAIAGIIIAVGTGVDHMIIITDETLRGSEQVYEWKKKIKNAFFIITGAYLTTLVAMLPLWWAGAGLLKGFALTTILGITIGVFIVRPAYAAAIEILLK